MYRYMPMTAAHNWHTQGGEAKHERAAIESFCEWAEELDNRREKKIPLRKGRKSPSRLQGGGEIFERGRLPREKAGTMGQSQPLHFLLSFGGIILSSTASLYRAIQWVGLHR